MLKLSDINYRYPDADREALSNLSLELRAGETVCLMGGNGSGKSTLAHLIAGLLAPSSGSVEFSDGTPNVGMLFQDPDNQMVALVVEKEVSFGLENRAVPMSEMAVRVTHGLESFGIGALRRRLTTELSGGEKQLVCLASVMVTDPDILILDEPDAYLDDPSRERLEAQLAEVRTKHPAVIEVRITQDVDVASRYPRLIVLEGGRVAADGPPSELLNDPTVQQQIGLTGDGSHVPANLRMAPPPDLVSKAELRQVSFCYSASSRQLSAVNFTLHTGEIVGLRGATGSGKTTVGLLLCGLLKPTGGSVALEMVGGSRINPADRPGLITGAFQQPERQFFLESCASEIRFGPENQGRQLDDGDLSDLLNLVGLPFERFADREPATLSTGEKRRLAFACLLSLGSRLLVFDEPTAGLDLEGQRLFVGLARSLKSDGYGMLVISHDSRLLDELADRNYLLGEGTLSALS